MLTEDRLEKIRRKPLKMRMPTESQEQQALFKWADLSLGRYPELELLFAVPNGRKRSVIDGYLLKKEGVKRGIPDIFLPVARKGYHGLFIELKRDSQRAKLTPQQSEMLSKLLAQGYYVTVCYGWKSAAMTLQSYLDDNAYLVNLYES